MNSAALLKDRSRAICFLGAAALLWGAVGCQLPLQTDDFVQLSPTYGVSTPDGNWNCHVHGWVYRIGVRAEAAALFAGEFVGGDDEDEESSLDEDGTAERVQRFFVDKKTNRRIRLRVGPQEFIAPPTDREGFFAGSLYVPGGVVQSTTIDALTGVATLEARVVTPPGDPRDFAGPVYLIPPRGVSVISDIDDTIRLHDGESHREKASRSFREVFRPVPGMAAYFQRLRQERAAAFHYVSNSPWQFAPWLLEFFEAHGFPGGTLQLRGYKIGVPWKLVKTWGPGKQAIIERILADFPQRKFILIGDTWEQDPEIYGEIARRHPEQIVGIRLRIATEEDPDPARMAAAMRGVPRDRWQTFRSPEEIRE
jgi:phosphatidate phosphatase APP1